MSGELIITKDNIKKLIDKCKNVLCTIRKMAFTKFGEENQSKIEEEVKACLKEFCYYLILAQKGEGMAPSEKDVLEYIFNDIFAECRKLRQIYERQKVMEKLQLIKQKLFQISQSDTCKNYVRNLDLEAKEFKTNIEDNKYLNSFCLDLLAELEVLIKRIEGARKEIKIQVGFEAATGVLTLGSSVAGGTIGIIGAVARTGTASEASSAVKGVTNTAGQK